MSLKEFKAGFDIGAHVNFASQVNGNPLPGLNSGWGIQNNTPTQQRGMLHHFGVDRIMVSAKRIGAAGPGSGSGTFSLDPLFQNETAQGSFLKQSAPGASLSRRHLAVGQYNPATGQQKLYAGTSGRDETQIWESIDPSTLVSIDFPFTLLTPGKSHISVFPPATDGYWNSGATSGIVGNAHVFFEGMTIGGHDNVPVGSHPQGLVLQNCYSTQWGGGSDGDSSLGWVDAATTEFVGWLNTPGRVTATPGTNPILEPTIDGENFSWCPIYFMHDDDSTFATPKGRLMLQSITAIDDGANMATYIKIIDFDPFGVGASSSIARTHLRVRTLSKLLQPYAPLAVGFPTQTSANMFHWFTWRRQSDLVITVNGDAAHTLGVIDPMELLSISSYNRAAVTTVVAPNQLRPIVTNDVIEFEATARGDLGEYIAGISCNFTLGNITTETEEITKAFPGGFQLENFPLDDMGLLMIFETTGGVPTLLLETTDWTMNYATGVGTWVTDQSGSDIVEASYQHADFPGDSPHGTLLNTTGTTDENGQAFVRVRNEDGFIVMVGDRITVAMDDS